MSEPTATVSVVISARNAAADLPRCLRSVFAQEPPVREVIVVDDASADATAATAQQAGCRVVRLELPAGVGGARNAGARIAEGDVLAFLDSDAEARPGWARAIAAAADAGAEIVAGEITAPKPRTVAEWYSNARFGRHDLRAGNGFLPYVIGANFVIRRELFEELGGFDTVLSGSEDVDLSFRAQLTGHSISPVHDAAVVHHQRTTVGALLRQQFRNARARPALRWKYRRFPFQGAGRAADARRIWEVVLFSAIKRAPAVGRDPRFIAVPFLDAAVLAARGSG